MGRCGTSRRKSSRAAGGVWGAVALLGATAVYAACGATSDQATSTGAYQVGPLSLVAGVGHVPLSGCAAADYFAQVSIGGQTRNLLVDSGSTTLAAAVTSCTTCAPAKPYSLSPTGRRLGLAASSEYFDGSGWSGVTYVDTVAMGNQTVTATPLVAVTFAGITQAKSFFGTVAECSPTESVAFDGILGLGPDAQLVAQTTSFMSSLAQSGRLAGDLFAVHTCDVGGDLYFGGWDVDKVTAAPNYTPLISSSSAQNATGGYLVNVQQMSLNGTDFGLAASSLGPALVDNGTGGIVMPSEAFDVFERLIEQNQDYLDNFGAGFISASNAQCAASAKGLTRAQLDAVLPTLSYHFPDGLGGVFAITLPATSSYLIAGTAQDQAGTPTLYCPSVSTSPSTAIIGNAAMRKHMVIFDRAQQRIGFAKEQGCLPQNVTYFTNGT